VDILFIHLQELETLKFLQVQLYVSILLLLVVVAAVTQFIVTLLAVEVVLEVC
jgi:hypothetical protein